VILLDKACEPNVAHMRCAAVRNQSSGLPGRFGIPAYLGPEAIATKVDDCSADVHSFGECMSVASTTVLVPERIAFRRRDVYFPLLYFS
jgi:hypothetical protein